MSPDLFSCLHIHLLTCFPLSSPVHMSLLLPARFPHSMPDGLWSGLTVYPIMPATIREDQMKTTKWQELDNIAESTASSILSLTFFLLLSFISASSLLITLCNGNLVLICDIRVQESFISVLLLQCSLLWLGSTAAKIQTRGADTSSRH
ncbi:hypothetical protein JOB18_011239 [Solea senegalensis]|uniref:Uncharacterized protein n=1 Tax=Solea senegalensis TaxID=28829 RepID=A0AAV6Q4U9_SOLSE|nr:hypothetical protein JOB18_011239 [Solea senegalensis]